MVVKRTVCLLTFDLLPWQWRCCFCLLFFILNTIFLISKGYSRFSWVSSSESILLSFKEDCLLGILMESLPFIKTWKEIVIPLSSVEDILEFCCYGKGFIVICWIVIDAVGNNGRKMVMSNTFKKGVGRPIFMICLKVVMRKVEGIF